MKEHIQAPQSHFIWQPLLLLAVIGYLIAEIYFLTVMVNTFDAGTRASDFSALEFIGRLISGAGIGLSVLIGLSLNRRLNEANPFKRILFKIFIFVCCTVLGYFAVKSLYQLMENNASKSVVHCSVLGNAAIRIFDRGQLPGFVFLGNKTTQKDNADRQLIRLYLPLHICMHDKYRRSLQASDVIKQELTAMVMETGLPHKMAAPAVDIYQGFRQRIADVASDVARLDGVHGEPEAMFQLREDALRRLEKLLKSQSRYTSTDVKHIVSIYACALDTATSDSQFSIGTLPVHNLHESPLEQRFMKGLTRCLYDRARSNFKTIREVNQATDIYILEQEIAAGQAQQFILSPHNIPEKALRLMRHSFALVFLPTYAVLISTFVVFLCLASYLRTRFLIRACKREKRVNPVINAILSPLVVVPGVWTSIFLLVNTPQVEKALFPGYNQSGWVQMIKVTLRPLFYYYEYSYHGLAKLKVPLFLASADTLHRHDASLREQEELEQMIEGIKGYYVGEICSHECQRIVLDLHPMNENYGILKYQQNRCESRLILDDIKQDTLRYFEVSQSDKECSGHDQWLMSHSGTDILRVQLTSEGSSATTSLRNLHI